MVQEVMPMPRGMIAAPPMPQYGMPMNGQMPPHPPMMPPMPPMPPQPPQQQGAQPQGAPSQADPWAGGINPSLTALLPPQGGAPGYGSPAANPYGPAPYAQPAPAPYAQPAPAPYAQPAPAPYAQPAPAPYAQPVTAAPVEPAPAQSATVATAQPVTAAQVEPTPASTPVQPTPIARPGWAWPPATIGVSIDPGALVGAPVQSVTTAPELKELIPATATLHPWRQEPPAAADPAVSPWQPVMEALATARKSLQNLGVQAQPDVPPNPWRSAANALPSPWHSPMTARPGAPTYPAGEAQPAVPSSPVPPAAPAPEGAGPVEAASADEPEPTAQPYYPTLAPATAPQPTPPAERAPLPPALDGTYSTRSGRSARKIL